MFLHKLGLRLAVMLIMLAVLVMTGSVIVAPVLAEPLAQESTADAVVIVTNTPQDETDAIVATDAPAETEAATVTDEATDEAPVVVVIPGDDIGDAELEEWQVFLFDKATETIIKAVESGERQNTLAFVGIAVIVVLAGIGLFLSSPPSRKLAVIDAVQARTGSVEEVLIEQQEEARETADPTDDLRTSGLLSAIKLMNDTLQRIEDSLRPGTTTISTNIDPDQAAMIAQGLGDLGYEIRSAGNSGGGGVPTEDVRSTVYREDDLR